MPRFGTTIRNEHLYSGITLESAGCGRSMAKSGNSRVEVKASKIEAVMEEKSILIADKDTEFLKEVADHFTGEGYEVEVTDSTVHVICNILKKHTPVILLGSDFEKNIDLTQMVKMLKKCNRHLAVILVSDEASLPQVRRLKQEGIFYHALRPVTSADCDEIKQAVDCALKKNFSA